MNKGNALPVFARGFDRVRLALQTSLSAGVNVEGAIDASKEPMRWTSACLRDGYQVRYRRNLDDLGYRDVPMRGTRSDSLNAVCHLRGLFSSEAVSALREIGRALERSASSSNWIISKRVRAVTNRSRFIDDMMHDRAFLMRVSRLAGAPLIPYPMVNARSQFNYYYPTDSRDHGKEQLGMWHTDGTSFVLNIVLSDRADYEGGNFLFYESTAETFDRHDKERRHVKTANLDTAGDALLIYGSKLFHGVEPVEAGRRMSLVLSFHCPYTREDDNGFWHLASDDGIPRTIVNWLALQRALRDDAELQYHRLGLEPIRPEDLADQRLFPATF
ncbi:2OG-Fe(II) oxygenase [Burkholderia sp. BCC1644]|uniref:2OG-Fe(II) oxygenase n=1 Tax=Burkholderia sp. BCC1644 TaxID=2676293 RepID=UPI001591FE7F|nr:2OG-Fe(II) oxygenase [Burkholderia sp. BCC1644]